MGEIYHHIPSKPRTVGCLHIYVYIIETIKPCFLINLQAEIIRKDAAYVCRILRVLNYGGFPILNLPGNSFVLIVFVMEGLRKYFIQDTSAVLYLYWGIPFSVSIWFLKMTVFSVC